MWAASLWGMHLTCHEFASNAAVGVSKLCWEKSYRTKRKTTSNWVKQHKAK